MFEGSNANGFTESFKKYFGNNNLSSPYFFSKQMQRCITSAFVESLCASSSYNNTWLPYEVINTQTTIVDCYGKMYEKFCLEVFEARPSKILWKSRDGSARSGMSWVSLYGFINNCTEKESIEGLSKHFCLDKLHLFQLNTENILKDVQDKSGLRCAVYEKSIVGYIGVPEIVKCKELFFELFSIKYLRSIGGIYGALFVYKDQNANEFLLPGKIVCESELPAFGYGQNVYNNYVKIGSPSYLYLYGEENLYSHERAIVFVCANPLIAIDINNVISDSKRFDFSTFVAVSWYGGDRYREVIDFNSLYDKDVIFIPELSRSCFQDVLWFYDKCTSVEVKSFKVLRSPVLRFADIDLEEDPQLLSDPFERYLAMNFFCLPKHESVVLNDVKEMAIDFFDYCKWCASVGINSGAEVELTVDIKISRNPRLKSDSLSRNIICSKNLSNFFSRQYLTGIIGSSDSGKSWVGYSFALALSYGIEMFGFDGSTPVGIMYIDGEISGEDFDSRVRRLVNSYGLGSEYICNFNHISLRQNKIVTECDISNQATRSLIEAEISRVKPSVIFFDNLMSLTKNAYASGKTWSNLCDWFKRLSDVFSVAVVFIHHTNKNDDIKGIVDIESTSQNIIMLDDIDCLVKEGKIDGTHSEIQKYNDKPGCFARMLFNKCKCYPDLKGKQFYYFLGYDHSNPETGLGWIEVVLDATKLNLDGMASTAKADEVHQKILSKFADLDIECKDVVEYALNTNHFSRKNVENLLNCKMSKAQNILKVLADKQILDVLGKGKGTRYKISDRLLV